VDAEQSGVHMKKRNAFFLFSVRVRQLPTLNWKDRMNRNLSASRSTTRHLAAGLLALSLLGGGAGAAAAGTDTAPRDTAAQPQARAALPALSAGAARTTVKAWEEFRIKGRTQAVLPGTTIMLQQKQGEHWVTLPAQTTVRRDGSYVLRAKLGVKGENRLRMAAAGTTSAPFTVTVR
jgi:hypothetical protein